MLEFRKVPAQKKQNMLATTYPRKNIPAQKLSICMVCNLCVFCPVAVGPQNRFVGDGAPQRVDALKETGGHAGG